MTDLDRIRAIDTHVHIQVDDSGHFGASDEQREAMDRYFGSGEPTRTVDETAAYYRERDMMAVVFTVDATTNTGHAPNSIDDIVAGAARNADTLIAFGSVDPLQGDAALAELHRQAGDLGVRGFKFHPTVQGFDPSAPEFDPLFAAIEQLRLPIVVHTGQTGVGAGVPGGLGLRLGLSNPMLLDDVAARHPELPIILAHPSVPWQDEAISIATHKANVWIDLSGWSPKYFSPALVRATRTYLKHKMLFGSDFPALTPDRWLRDFAGLELPDEVVRLVLKDNAVRLLGLEGGS
ncbi:amidohydrolase family protein [Microbacterium elymi]|uniref:Amidohydrolase family protein n=1 Tax=Microbacterium elymi TaxID=2909587 RepID=A0ABY5NM80_9MICO|nr:amidohydrolase family protein [Microbacterium elymi]UUT36224.1 amidohydrolase family protein [Microbacterium elymi]